MRTYVSRTWHTEHGATMPSGRIYQGPSHWHYTVMLAGGGSHSLGGFESRYLARIGAAAFVAGWSRKLDMP